MSSGATFRGLTRAPEAPGPDVLLPQPLPISQLESLRFKANQIIESINTLAFTLSGGMNPAYMPAWPEILSKYNIILSQYTNFSNALLNPYPAAANRAQTTTNEGPPENIYQKIVVHPNIGMLDMQFDTEIGPLLRNQQTLDVLKQENDTVRRLSEHMTTRGMLGVLGITSEGTAEPAVPAASYRPLHLNGFGGLGVPPPRKPEYEDVLAECAEIRNAHDQRVERAVRAVSMLRDQFEFKQRVEAMHEETDEFWGPSMGRGPNDEDEDMDSDEGDDHDDGDEEHEDKGSDDEDEDNIQGELMGQDEEMDSPAPMNTEPPAPVPSQTLTPMQQPAPPSSTSTPVHTIPTPVPPAPPANPPAQTAQVDEPQIVSHNVPDIIDLTEL
ncbi:hypothetical protein CC2G_003081 [Coprinopsis cinerea AmutBmut pab1-1]|nr:hypothetical protein CC2G_003081 [Coprinopsis cinerea AmutBmut pab1-1]